MVDKKETPVTPPELIIDNDSEVPIFRLELDRPFRPGDLPLPEWIASITAPEAAPNLPGTELLGLSFDSIGFGDEHRLARRPEPPERLERPEAPTLPIERFNVDPSDAAALALVLKNYPAQSLVPATGLNQEKHIIFTLAGTRYTVLMSHVIEVGELNSFTKIPNVPEWVLGITNLHGDIVSIVDIRALLGLEREDCMENFNLLVTQTFEGDITASLVVEQVLGIANISAAQIQVVETAAEDGLTSYVRGVYTCGGELLNVLNLEGLLRSLDVVH
ncbi:MAG TPA: chemotaxis protein CheW [Blastocatellia bacterium]|nr:chemotaxis protein CheW [Blastocatellia bacterium]